MDTASTRNLTLAAPAPDWTYWVVPGQFLAGCFPGSSDPEEQEQKLGQLLDAGVRTFINLMEDDEKNRSGIAFNDYLRHARQLGEARGVPVRGLRLPIRDLTVPTPQEMRKILTEIDRALQEGPIYVHCWGGVGRTGTVVACWLMHTGRATHQDVLQVLKEMRKADRQRGHRASPETPVQLRFLKEWASH